jgi:hypothetical protein
LNVFDVYSTNWIKRSVVFFKSSELKNYYLIVVLKKKWSSKAVGGRKLPFLKCTQFQERQGPTMILSAQFQNYKNGQTTSFLSSALFTTPPDNWFEGES